MTTRVKIISFVKIPSISDNYSRKRKSAKVISHLISGRRTSTDAERRVPHFSDLIWDERRASSEGSTKEDFETSASPPLRHTFLFLPCRTRPHLRDKEDDENNNDDARDLIHHDLIRQNAKDRDEMKDSPTRKDPGDVDVVPHGAWASPPCTSGSQHQGSNLIFTLR